MGWHSFYSFKGRATRLEYWVVLIVLVFGFVCFYAAAEFIFGIPLFLENVTDLNWVEQIAYHLVSISFVFFAAPITLRRLHDRNKGVGWLIFYSSASLAFDAQEFLVSLEFGQWLIGGSLSVLFFAFGLIVGLMSIVDLGFLPGNARLNRYGIGVHLSSIEDVEIFD